MDSSIPNPTHSEPEGFANIRSTAAIMLDAQRTLSRSTDTFSDHAGPAQEGGNDGTFWEQSAEWEDEYEQDDPAPVEKILKASIRRPTHEPDALVDPTVNPWQ